VTVNVVASTTIRKSGVGKAMVDDLAVGDRVKASYDKGSMEALVLVVSNPLDKHRGFEGTIKSITSDHLVLSTKNNAAEVSIGVNSETSYKVPGLKDAKLTNFKQGDRVAILAMQAAGANVALHVHLIPAKPSHVHRVGTIEAYQPGKLITLKNRKLETSTFVVNADTQIRFKRGADEVKVGDRAKVIARWDPASDKFIAKAILVLGSKGRVKKGPPSGYGKP
jgi:hypothetical protein